MTTIEMDTAEKLKQLGFTLNEAKAYLALLACQPASAYEIAKQAGLPTSKIYETVNRLSRRAVMQPTQDAQGNQQYYAMNPSDLMESIRANTINETNELLPDLLKVPGSQQNNLIWPLTDESQMRSRVLETIESAQQTLLVSLWPEELTWCEEALRRAEQRDIQIALVHFGKPNVRIGATYHHPVERTLYAEKGGRGLTIVADGHQVVIATINDDELVEGAWSRNASFVTVAEDYVKHDVYITKVTRFLNSEMIQRFGEDYARLRDVFDAEA